jgi:hypothetical protein
MKEFPEDKQFIILWISFDERDIDKKKKHKWQVLAEEKLHDKTARLEHTPRKSLKCLTQETGVS